ncbi:MAG TPA: hypothetical protein P5137_12175 [Candidatus Brocadiia bacterium]|nr:hypothetical protein [Candidatus Brocadiia bacterium]
MTRLIRLALFSACVALAAGAAALGATSTGTRTQQQLSDNERWREAAEKQQADYMKQAQKYESDKRYADAIACYRKAMNVRYSQWDIRRRDSVKVVVKGDDYDENADTNYLPGRRKQTFVLKNNICDQAKKKIDSLLGKQATASLDELDEQAKKARKNKEYGQEYAILKDLLKAAESSPRSEAEKFVSRTQSRLKSIETSALQKLTATERALNGNRQDTAVKTFTEYEDQYGELEGADKINAKYQELTKNPALLKIKGAAEAKEHLARAAEYLKEQRQDFAYHEFQLILEEFSDTDEAKEAAKGVEAIESSPDQMLKVHAPRAREYYARELLRRAEAAAKDNDTITARRLLKYIVLRYSDTTSIRTAQSRLEGAE